ncbi:hypothetical protein KIN20_036158 [Parelaphostrongylus tenuis]|uniref:Uncharacterized protein n=1 Tax=Parelaphostrongylus tenuis TaxID=148309 RepID=A0AAD5RCH0_PARTN|nr:hypothetical protein KIN20_036158 [Parelaphostrongylus tenuis]
MDDMIEDKVVLMSSLLGIINYVNPRTWYNYFFRRNGQTEHRIEYQDEEKFDENKSNWTSDHREKRSS